jgi:cbb3-type cytochrome oxidase subunit 3
MMDWGSITYLGVTFGLFVIFVLIVIRTYSKKRKDEGEIAKYRMLDDD